MATYYVDGLTGDDGTGTGSIGSPWATIEHGLATMTGGDTLYVKSSATYTPAADLVVPGGSLGVPTQVFGYTTTPGDDGLATVQPTGGHTYVWNLSNNYFTVRNFICDCNAVLDRGIILVGHGMVCNLTVENYNEIGIINGNVFCSINCCTVTGGRASATAAFYANGPTTLFACVPHDNTGIGFRLESGSCTLDRCVSSGNSSYGIYNDDVRNRVINCTVHGNTNDGIRFTAGSELGAVVVNNVVTSNGGYGLYFANAVGAEVFVDYNAFRSNTSGPVNNVSAGDHDVTLSADPYTNAAGGDFTLNNTAGGGAACRAAAFPGAMQYGGTGYLDLGALQHQDSGGGAAGMLYVPNLEAT